MRLLLTTDTVGGVWTYTRELTEGLLARSHSVALASIGPAPSPEQAAWAASFSPHLPSTFTFTAIDAPLEWQPENSTAYTAAAPGLLALAESFRPDLILSSQFCFGALPLAIPRLVVAHSDVLSWAEACRPEGLEPSPWLDQYRALVQAGLSAATAVLAPTHSMQASLARNFELPARTAVIPNGRTLPSAPSSPRALQAVTAGRLWDEAKNLALLESLYAEQPAPLPIRIAGEHRRSVPTPSHLDLLGHLAEPDLLALFRSSAIYLATSLYEPFGLAPLEAALCGCAVLANDIPSLREVWGDAALFFHDACSLDHLLRSLIADPAALAAAQHRSHARALTLSSDSSLHNTLRLIRDLLKHPQEPHAAA